MGQGEGDQVGGINCHLYRGAMGFPAIKHFILLILIFLSGSITQMTSPVMAEFGDSDRSLRNGFSNYHSEYNYNYLSRALERLHFGPLLKLRSISSRGLPQKFASDLSKPKVKKALSYLRMFYPVLQPQGGQPLRSKSSLRLSSSRRRTLYPQSSETGTYPGGRITRPMRLRWGK